MGEQRFKKLPIGNVDEFIKRRKIDISKATILKETKITPSTSKEITEGEEEVKSNENLQDTKTVNVKESLKNDPEEKAQINFYSEEEVLGHTGSKAKDGSKPEEKRESVFGKDETVESVRKEIADASNNKEEYTLEYFEDIATIIITLIDSLVSGGLKWWARSKSSDLEFSLAKPKQDKLIRQLSRILMKYQAKFSLEFMFLIMVIAMYAPGVIKARNYRKENKPVQVKTPIKESKPIVEEVVYTETVTENADEHNEGEEPVKKQRGRPKHKL